MHCLVLIATLLVNLASSQSEDPKDTEPPDTTILSPVLEIVRGSNFSTSTPKPTISQPGPDTGNKSRSQDADNCITICLNTMNVVIFGVVLSLVLCICGVICQQQPREVFYLVDRVPESNAAVRPTTLSIDPKIRTGKSQQPSPANKEPVTVSEPLITPKHTRTPATAVTSIAPDSSGSAPNKSVQIEISPQENVSMAHSPFYTTQGSIEDDLLPDSQHQQTPFVRPVTPIGAAVANAVGVPSDQTPIVISESSGRVSEPSSPIMPI